MKQCKCEHWQQCPICMPHRFDAEGNVLPPKLTPLEEAREQIKQLTAKAEMDYAIMAGNNALITGLKAELAEYRSALKMYANDKNLDCTIALRVLKEASK